MAKSKWMAWLIIIKKKKLELEIMLTEKNHNKLLNNIYSYYLRDFSFLESSFSKLKNTHAPYV